MKRQIQSRIDDFVKKKSISVIDIETTGFNPINDCIVEIGIVELDLFTGKCTKLFDQVVIENNFSPKFEDSWIFSNSSLTYNDILKGNSLNFYVEEIQMILDKYPATAYNKNFDFGFLKNRGFKIMELQCPMIAATNIIKLPPTKPETLYKWPSVEESWSFFFPNFHYIEKHRAYDDAEHEALIVYEMFKRGDWHFNSN